MTEPEWCTNQLSLREVAFPPQVFLQGGDGRQAVVRVHQHVDETVQGRPKETFKQIEQNKC